MAKFLNNDDFGPAVRKLLQGGSPRCAVAFWGQGACATLFGRKAKLLSVRVVCDLSMGGTNPEELRKLGATYSDRVTHIRGLHSKVYISDTGAIIGSGNASENGIGFSAGAGLIEAGVEMSSSSTSYKHVVQWFEALIGRAEQVGADALSEAEATWKRRSHSGNGKPGDTLVDPNSLLKIYTANPGRFRGVGFVLTSRSTKSQVRDAGADAVIATDAKQSKPELTQYDQTALREWPTAHTFSGWRKTDVSGWPERFICAHRESERFRYWFYERCRVIYTKDEGGIIFARLSRDLKRDLNLRMSRDTMAKADNLILSRLFSADGEYKVFMNGEQLASALNTIGID